MLELIEAFLQAVKHHGNGLMNTLQNPEELFLCEYVHILYLMHGLQNVT